MWGFDWLIGEEKNKKESNLKLTSAFYAGVQLRPNDVAPLRH
jgi:hypothetical protein